MGIPWGTITRNIGSVLAKAIGVAEEAYPGRGEGPKKKDLVKNLLLFGLELSERALDRELLDDPEVAAAYDSAIDAIVHFQNAIEKARSVRDVRDGSGRG